MKNIIMILLMTFSMNLFAGIETLKPNTNKSAFEFFGGWSSGGGNAVVCFDITKDPGIRGLLGQKHAIIPDKFLPYITSIEFFDLYTAKIPRGLDFDQPIINQIQDSEKIEDYVQRSRARFADNITAISKILDYGLEDISTQDIRMHNAAILQKEDIDAIGLIDENNCMFSTIALQRTTGNFTELHIDYRLFNLMSRQSKATLFLHEYVYRYFRNLGDETSYKTRKIVENIISKYEGQTTYSLAKLLRKLEVFPDETWNYFDYDFDEYQYVLLYSALGKQINSAFTKASYGLYDLYYDTQYRELSELAKFFSIDTLIFGDSLDPFQEYIGDHRSLGELCDDNGSCRNFSSWIKEIEDNRYKEVWDVLYRRFQSEFMNISFDYTFLGQTLKLDVDQLFNSQQSRIIEDIAKSFNEVVYVPNGSSHIKYFSYQNLIGYNSAINNLNYFWLFYLNSNVISPQAIPFK